jgi:hypothetical protein
LVNQINTGAMHNRKVRLSNFREECGTSTGELSWDTGGCFHADYIEFMLAEFRTHRKNRRERFAKVMN